MTAVNYRLCSYGKSNYVLTSSQKWSGGVILHMIAFLLQGKLCDILFILYCSYDITRRDLFNIFRSTIETWFFRKNKCSFLHNYTQRGEKLRKMTSCLQLKNNFFLFLFRMINVYFVRERFELSIGIYISTENIFHMKLASLNKMVKTQKSVSQKQNKKNWRQ